MEKAMVVIESKGLKQEEILLLKRLVQNFRKARKESGEAELSYLVAGDGKDYALTPLLSKTNSRGKGEDNGEEDKD